MKKMVTDLQRHLRLLSDHLEDGVRDARGGIPLVDVRLHHNTSVEGGLVVFLKERCITQQSRNMLYLVLRAVVGMTAVRLIGADQIRFADRFFERRCVSSRSHPTQKPFGRSARRSLRRFAATLLIK